MKQIHLALLFRDYLRTHEDDAQRYAALKYQLAEKYRADRQGYTEAKGPYIMRILFIAIIVLVVVLLLGGTIHSLVSQIPLNTAIQDVIGGIVGIVSDLGNAIARILTNILPKPGRL